MDGKKWRIKLENLMLVFLLLGIAAGICKLYWHYLYYRKTEETGAQMKQEAAEGEKEEHPEATKTESRAKEKYLETAEMRSDMEWGSSETEQQKSLQWEKTDLNQMIRVCLCSEDYASQLHQSVKATGKSGLQVLRLTEPRQELSIEKEEAWEANAEQMEPGEVWKVTANDTEGIQVSSIERAQGIPEYEGVLYLCRSTEGIVLINELPLEVYLYSVVASEMPSDYPLEAQKAQAVCARTYAFHCIENRDQKETFEIACERWQQEAEFDQCDLWDLDDSVAFQVYNNQKVQEISTESVKMTEREILDLKEVLYYSTSVGSEDRTDLGTEEAFSDFLLQCTSDGAEYDSPWLRWQTKISYEDIRTHLKQYKKLDLEGDLSFEIIERNGQGQAQKMAVKEAGETVLTTEGEYEIRRILSPEQDEILLQDGTSVSDMTMLPSAYFVLKSEEDGVAINGGGYGHGIGMSQCGAAALAEEGRDYREILEYYYGAVAF